MISINVQYPHRLSPRRHVEYMLGLSVAFCFTLACWFHHQLSSFDTSSRHASERRPPTTPVSRLRGVLPQQAIHVLSTSTAANESAQRLPKIVVGGIMRNLNTGDGYLDYFFLKLLSLIKDISFEFHIVIYENDSIDGTREKLLHYLGNASYATLIMEDNSPDSEKDVGILSKERTNRIAHSRNAVLSFCRQHLSNHFDYLFMMDMDGVCGGPDMSKSYDPNIFKYALLELQDQWDGIFFRFEPYWDLWALRIPDLLPDNYWFPQGRSKRAINKDAHNVGLYLEQLPWPEGLMVVDSAFEMAAIYRMEMIRNTTAHYNGTSDESGRADCEHVAFNLGLRQQYNARLRLSRLVYCQGDERYAQLPDSVTNPWSGYVSYNQRSLASVEATSISSRLPHDGYAGYWNVIRIMNPPPT